MISTGTISIPRRYESFKLLVANFTCDMLNGKLSNFVAPGSQGYIVADFVNNPVNGTPHAAHGLIQIVDGNAKPILDIQSAVVQIEEGPREGAWHTLQDIAINGFDAAGFAYAFRAVGADPGDPVSSLLVEFGITDIPGLRGFLETAVWGAS